MLKTQLLGHLKGRSVSLSTEVVYNLEMMVLKVCSRSLRLSSLFNDFSIPVFPHATLAISHASPFRRWLKRDLESHIDGS